MRLHCVCDSCGFSFREVSWPVGCPNCKAGAHWLTVFTVAWHAEDYVPLCERGEAA